MKKATLILALVITAAGFMACNTTQKQLRQVSAEKIDSSYTIQVGQDVTITLESNPSTGYKWELAGQSHKKIVSREGREYKADSQNENMVGAGGTDNWTFKGQKAGEVVLLLKYKKENSDQVKKTYRKIIVKE